MNDFKLLLNLQFFITWFIRILLLVQENIPSRHFNPVPISIRSDFHRSGRIGHIKIILAFHSKINGRKDDQIGAFQILYKNVYFL